MAIPTSRTKENAQITLFTDLCIGCGSCVEVCKDFNYKIVNHKVALADTSLFGCIACGHCVAICPTGTIEINGRFLTKNDLFELPGKSEAANYNQLLALFQRRRSIREFTDEPVSSDIIQKVIEAAQTSPMGLPPSDVHLMVLDSKEKNRAFVIDFVNYMQSMKWFVSGWFLALMRPFWGKTNDELFKGFVKPLFKAYTESNQRGENIVTYDAPVAIYFYGSPYTDPADPIVAATAAMYAAESLGLGTCMLGAIHPLIQNGKKAKRLREKYGIKYPSREGVFVIFGHPKPKYLKGIRRSFASVDFVK